MASLQDRVNVGLGAVLTDDEGRFLLSERLADKHGKGTWGFPGGKPDPGESPLQGCLRELEEETGIVASWGQPLGVWTYDRWDSEGIHYVTLYYMVDHDGQEPQNLEPEKHSGWEWLSAEEAFKRPLFAGVGKILDLLS